ncbi:hypothetical protein ACRCUN_21985 [Mycobacterium sp. LTG2003]
MDGVRIHAVDLQDAQRRADKLRADAPDVPVLLDIEVLIDRDIHAAFAALDGAPSGHALRYIGTPRGLAGLIADVQRLGIADGVVLKPLAGSPVTDLMLEELAPGLCA